MTGLSQTAGLSGPARSPLATATRLQAPSGRLVVIGMLIFAAVWLLHLAATSLSAPVDNIEQLTWVRSLQWGYYKHPPLPTWLLWLPVQLLGSHIRIRADHVIADMVRMLGGHVQEVEAPFDPEAGAYAGGHEHLGDEHHGH